jgi:hypothetical protein
VVLLLIERVVTASVDCGGKAVGPDDDMFFSGIGEIVTGLPYSCEFCLEDRIVVGVCTKFRE